MRGSGSAWSSPETVAGFVRASPNETLLAFAAEELRRRGGGRALDLGCGAGRNALPLARMGWSVVGLWRKGSTNSDPRSERTSGASRGALHEETGLVAPPPRPRAHRAAGTDRLADRLAW